MATICHHREKEFKTLKKNLILKKKSISVKWSACAKYSPAKQLQLATSYTMRAQRCEKSERSPQNFTGEPHFEGISGTFGKAVAKLQADACFHFSVTLPLYLHLILPIQPFYIFITGVGRLMRKQSVLSGPSEASRPAAKTHKTA